MFLSVTLLSASALVPREKLKKNMESSAALLTERQVFYDIFEGIPASRIDRYADSILLSIAWQFKSDDPLKSVLWTSYYNYPYENENINFKESLEKNYDSNTQYIRYWHGSAAIVRFLHLFLDLKGIYILNGILLFIMALFLVILLFRKGFLPLSLGTALSLLTVSVWFVPFSLEYTWTFLLSLFFSIITVYLEDRGLSRFLGILFLISGMLTSFLDFLTTETLTLTFPLIIALFIRIKKDGCCKKEHRRFALLSAVIWGCSYVFMWAGKWLLTAIALKTNPLPYVQEHIEERISGDIGLSPIGYIIGSVWRNIRCLFPLGFGSAGVIAAVIIILISSYYCFVYRKKSFDRAAVLMFLCIALLPYVRYILLTNHSFIHFFFTFRAQAATILSLCICLFYIIDWRLLISRRS